MRLSLKVLLAAVVLGMGLSMKAEAASPARGAKSSATLNYTTTASSISLNGSAVVYAITVTTGAAGDFVALFDTNTVVGVASTFVTTGILKTRCYAGSTVTATTCSYDPPLQFTKGISAILSSANDQALITYEPGRVVQGY